jgi:hypothetical protein
MLVFLQNRTHNKFMSFFIITILVLSLFFGAYVQSFALVPVIAIAGVAVLGALLVAYGYYNLSSSDVNSIWNSMSTDLQDKLSSAGLKGTPLSKLGLATVGISIDTINQFTTFFQSKNYDKAAPVPVASSDNSGLNAMLNQTQSIFTNYYVGTYDGLQVNSIEAYFKMQQFAGSAPYRIIVKKVYNGAVTMCLYYSNYPYEAIYNRSGYIDFYNDHPNYYCFFKDADFTKSYEQGTYNTYSALSAVSNGFSYSWSSTPMTVYSDYAVNNNPTRHALATLYYTGSSLIKQTYNPSSAPLVADSSGNVNISVPTSDDINVPTATGTSSISLDDVIKYYGSIDGFFESGGVITLADGTQFSNIHDMTRTTVVENTGTNSGANTYTDTANLTVQAADFSTPIITATGFPLFTKSFDAINKMNTSKGSAPKFYINLHQLLDTVAVRFHFGNPFPDKDSVFIDLSFLDTWSFGGKSLIDYFRFITGMGMVVATGMYR